MRSKMNMMRSIKMMIRRSLKRRRRIKGGEISEEGVGGRWTWRDV
jgi:hypothetical protein